MIFFQHSHFLKRRKIRSFRVLYVVYSLAIFSILNPFPTVVNAQSAEINLLRLHQKCGIIIDEYENLNFDLIKGNSNTTFHCAYILLTGRTNLRLVVNNQDTTILSLTALNEMHKKIEASSYSGSNVNELDSSALCQPTYSRIIDYMAYLNPSAPNRDPVIADTLSQNKNRLFIDLTPLGLAGYRQVTAYYCGLQIHILMPKAICTISYMAGINGKLSGYYFFTDSYTRSYNSFGVSLGPIIKSGSSIIVFSAGFSIEQYIDKVHRGGLFNTNSTETLSSRLFPGFLLGTQFHLFGENGIGPSIGLQVGICKEATAIGATVSFRIGRLMNAASKKK